MYFIYDGALYLIDGVILYKDRVVEPVSLQSRVLNKLNLAHQGVTSMHNRVQKSVFWHIIAQDIIQFGPNVKAATAIHLLNHHCHKQYLTILLLLLTILNSQK